MDNKTTKDQESRFDPLLVLVYPNGSPMTQQERLDSWLHLSKVSEEVYLLLSSSVISDALQRMRQSLQLSEDMTIRIAALMRMYYFGRASFEQFPLLLKNDVGLPQEKIVAVMSFIRTEILTLKAPMEVAEEGEVVAKPKTVSLQLLQVLEKFPRVNDQQITSERIRVRSERESVRGTVRNWLRAYRDAVGARQHTAVERGQFLFQSENTKNLSIQEREKVGLILKSLDDSELLTVNPEKQEVIFPVTTVSQQKRSVTAAPSRIPETVTHQSIRSIDRKQENPEYEKADPSKRMPSEPIVPAVPKKTFNFAKSPSVVSAVPANTPKESSVADRLASVVAKAPSEPLPGNENPFRFSSGHTLPAEKSIPASPAPRPAAPKSSFGLGYTGTMPAPVQKKEVWQVPASVQNVVDLRSEE